MQSNLFWCRKCNVPLLQKRCENCGIEGHVICSDLKPIFDTECKFLEGETGEKLPGRNWRDGLWMRYKTIWFNGKRIIRLSANGKPGIVKEYLSVNGWSSSKLRPTPEVLYKANKSSLDKLEQDAISFIRETTQSYPHKKPIISFSGGKDSTVVSYLVRKALNTNAILHIFGNTTMEYPDTLDYIKKFPGNNGDMPFYESSSNHRFLDLCKLIGPPSRINAWCCSVFKASPLAPIINNINGEDGVISFEGIRRRESLRRRHRQSTYSSKKIAYQLSAYPILEWKEIEVWLFILTREIDFNNAYEKGFTRVGCMYCPNNTPYNEHLIKTYYPEKIQTWMDFLFDYAKKIGKKDPTDYVKSGAWKMRVGKSKGWGSTYVKKFRCLKNMNAMHFVLSKKITDSFIERFKPFGRMEKFADFVGEGFIVKDVTTGEALFMVKRVKDIAILRQESKVTTNLKLGDEFLCVDLFTIKNRHHLLRRIERQIRKFQVCILCGACIGICPANAITINLHFEIDADKCTHCQRCISTQLLRDSCISLHANQQTSKYRGGS